MPYKQNEMMKTRNPLRMGLTYIVSAIIITTLAGCAGGENLRNTNNIVDIVLDEWTVNVKQQQISSGRVRINVDNQGSEEHEVVILRTALAEEKLPTHNGKVIEASAGTLIGEIEGIQPQTSASAEFDLSPGDYVLLCNLVEMEMGELESHYQNGMVRRIIVR